MKSIESKENPHFKSWKKIAQNRAKAFVFLEGAHLIQLYAARFGKVQTLIVEKNKALSVENRALVACADEVFLIAENLSRQLSNLDSPASVFAVCNVPQNAQNIDFQQNSVLLDGIQNPLNLGAILRVAAAANFHQVLIAKNSAHVFNPKSLRAAQGANFLLNIFENADLSDFVKHFQGDIFATCLDSDSKNLFDLTIKTPTAWIFGAEGQGIAKDLLKKVNIQKIKIPMAQGVESLNVASAAALCLFECFRTQ